LNESYRSEFASWVLRWVEERLQLVSIGKNTPHEIGKYIEAMCGYSFPNCMLWHFWHLMHAWSYKLRTEWSYVYLSCKKSLVMTLPQKLLFLRKKCPALY
jgi:hypothetical protein